MRAEDIDHLADGSTRRFEEVGTDAGRDFVALCIEVARYGTGCREGRRAELQFLVDLELQHDVERRFDRSAADLAIPLHGMSVADREERTLDLDGEVENRPRREV